MSKITSNQSGFLRLPEVLKRIPVSRATWWAGIKTGKYPAGFKLSERTTAWRLIDIDELEEQLIKQNMGVARAK